MLQFGARYGVIASCLLTGSLMADGLTLSADQRPAWVSRDGIVMAGSWEPLPFRVRRDGAAGYTAAPKEEAGYAREHSPQMLAELKDLGVNFVMMHCYKGGGLQAEHQSMQDAVQFARLCHDAGLYVGVYAYSGAFLWETFFQEMPQARDWLLLDASGKPLTYFTCPWRYYWNRNHPDAQAFYRGLVRFAVEDVHADLVHLDNFSVGPGSDAVSVERFRKYLAVRFTAEQRTAGGVSDLQAVRTPLQMAVEKPLRRAWIDFTAQSLADAYIDMSRYARTLRKDILMDCNPGGSGEGILPPVDHGRLLPGGDATWDESLASGYHDGRLRTRIRSYKIGRRMGNMVVAYTTSPLEAAEAMAFNLDCLGCICWFEYGKIVARPGFAKPLDPGLAAYVKFFHARRDLFRDAEVVADAAVFRSFPSQAFSSTEREAGLHAEESLIAGRVPFQIIYEPQLADLGRYRVLVLAGCAAMSDAQAELVRRFIAQGGRLCLVGEPGRADEWMNPRTHGLFANLSGAAVARVDEKTDVAQAVRRLLADDVSVAVNAEPGLCVELTRQSRRRLVHLVNYRVDRPVEDVAVSLPAVLKVTRVTLVSPDGGADLPTAFAVQGGRITFRVPRVSVYAVAVVE